MKNRIIKLIVCIAIVSSLMVGFCTSFASAVVSGGAGLLGSALGSLGVDLLAGGSATIATLAPWLNGDYSIRGVLTGVADGFIKVYDDSVIIDGVEYQSIFLDPSMAAVLHTQALDFITQKAIVDNSSGILATGAGYYGNVPIFNNNGTYISQYYNAVFPDSNGTSLYYGIGDYTIELARSRFSDSLSNYRSQAYIDTPPGLGNSGAGALSLIDTQLFLKPYSNTYSWYYFSPRDSTATRISTQISVFDSDPFTYSYVSRSIDATPLPSNYGFSAYIPATYLSGAGIAAGTYYNDNDLAIINLLIDLLDQAYADEAIENVEWAEEAQPVPPVPDTTIADTAYADLHDEMLDIKNNQAHANSALDNIDSNIDVIGRTVDNIDSTLTDIEGKVTHAETEIVDAVDTAGQSVVDGLSDVEGAIDTAGQSVVDGLSDVEGAVDTAGQSVVDSVEAQTQALEQSISDVADKVESLDTTVDEVIEKIESHPLDLFGAFLDRLTQIPVLRDLFNGIKQHVGIWHYVVEWLQCIGTFLSFFIGLFADVAYCMVVPIYACVAGAICLAFYKRFGR